MSDIQKSITALLDSVDRYYAKRVPMEESNDEIAFEMDDAVTWMASDGTQMRGVVEAVDADEKTVTVRAYAFAGKFSEPTDTVEVMRWNDVQKVSQTDQIEAGAYVDFETDDGPTKGRVKSVTDGIATVDVLACHNDEWEATGVSVQSDVANFTLCEPPKMSAIDGNRIFAKMRNVEFKMGMDADGREIGIIEGDGSVYGNTDLGGDIVEKGAFTQTLSHSGGVVQAYWDHAWNTGGLAGVCKCTDTEKALRASIHVPLWIPKCRDNYEMVKFVVGNGAKMGLSIGYDPIKTEPGAYGTRRLKELALLEMSVTPMPMNTEAMIDAVKRRRAGYVAKAAKWSHVKKLQSPDAPKGSTAADEGAFDWALAAAQINTLATKMKAIP